MKYFISGDYIKPNDNEETNKYVKEIQGHFSTIVNHKRITDMTDLNSISASIEEERNWTNVIILNIVRL